MGDTFTYKPSYFDLNEYIVDARQLWESMLSLMPNVSNLGSEAYLSGLGMVLSILVLLGCAWFFLSLNEEQRKEAKRNGNKRLNKKRKPIKIKFLKEYRNILMALAVQRGKEEAFERYFYGSFVLMAISAGFLIWVGQLFLAVAFPIFLFRFFRKAAKISMQSINEAVEEQIPFAIDNMLRVASKYDDLKTILFESSRRLEDPLKGILESTAMKMTSQNPETVLLDLGARFNSIWMYSYTFILMSYIKNANKEETLENLRYLRRMLAGENSTKREQKQEKKMSVAINWVIITAAFAAFLANVFVNPIGKEFFFESLGGIVTLFAGFGAIFSTILMNIKMSRK